MDTLQRSEHTETQKINVSTSSTKGQTQSPFGRSGIIKRTPSRSRTYSLPDFKQSETDRQNDIHTTPVAVKRKRSGSTSEKRTGKLKIASSTFETTIHGINTLAIQLEKVINETYRPKLEPSEICRSLLLQIERLHSEEVQKFIEVTTTQECLKAQNEKIKRENEELRMKIRSMGNERNRDCVEKMVKPEDKCAQCRAAQKMGQWRRILKKGETFESFSMVSEEDWVSEGKCLRVVHRLGHHPALQQKFCILKSSRKSSNKNIRRKRGVINRKGVSQWPKIHHLQADREENQTTP